VFAETPYSTANPGSGAVRQASNIRTASSCESQVDSARTLSGRSRKLPIRVATASMPYRSAYRLSSASAATFATP
jgi:hypothetical protein